MPDKNNDDLEDLPPSDLISLTFDVRENKTGHVVKIADPIKTTINLQTSDSSLALFFGAAAAINAYELYHERTSRRQLGIYGVYRNNCEVPDRYEVMFVLEPERYPPSI